MTRLVFQKSDMGGDAPLALLNLDHKVVNMSGPHLDNPTHKERRVADAIRAHLHTASLHTKYKHKAGKGTAGHCYIASEAAYHMLGGHAAGYKPVNLKHEGESHWYLRHTGKDGVRHLDLTSDQFQTLVPHAEGKGKGFLTKHPSKRAREVIHNAERHLAGD